MEEEGKEKGREEEEKGTDSLVTEELRALKQNIWPQPLNLELGGGLGRRIWG